MTYTPRFPDRPENTYDRARGVWVSTGTIPNDLSHASLLEILDTTKPEANESAEYWINPSVSSDRGSVQLYPQTFRQALQAAIADGPMEV